MFFLSTLALLNEVQEELLQYPQPGRWCCHRQNAKVLIIKFYMWWARRWYVSYLVWWHLVMPLQTKRGGILYYTLPNFESQFIHQHLDQLSWAWYSTDEMIFFFCFKFCWHKFYCLLFMDWLLLSYGECSVYLRHLKIWQLLQSMGFYTMVEKTSSNRWVPHHHFPAKFFCVISGMGDHVFFNSPGPKGHSELLPYQCICSVSSVNTWKQIFKHLLT